MKIDRRELLATMASLVGGTASLPTGAIAATAIQNARAPYKDPALPIPTRVEDLLSRMTLKEKVMQLRCIWEDKKLVLGTNGEFSNAMAKKAFPDGLGMVARPSDRFGAVPATPAVAGDSGVALNRTPEETAQLVNAMQRWAMEETRLGIPLFMHEEALHGYVANDATCFPQAIGLASSFDPDLISRIFAVAAREMRACGANFALAPVVDVARDPRWGRIEETYGEDAFLCGEMGKAAVIGFMGKTKTLGKDKVFATLKHMTGHGQPENGTNTGPANISERTLREEFFPPFEKVVRETQISAVMPSYNEIDGLPSHANHWMLTKILREEWGFKGLTVSDYFAVAELVSRHHLAENNMEAALRAFSAGVDIETPDVAGFSSLEALATAKRIPLKSIDAAVRRVLELKFHSGLFEDPYVDANAAAQKLATSDAVALAREAAARSVVLLKNRNKVLPLDPKKVGSVLLMGTHAKDCPIGGYSGVPRRVVSIYDGLKAESIAQGFPFAYVEGVRVTESRRWGQDEVTFTSPELNARLIAQAVEAAKAADTIVMVLGDNEQTSREAWSDTHLGDRSSLDLMGQQNDLAKAIFDLGKPTIVFLLNGRPLSVNLLADRADAIIEGWYMGQETGHAAVDILFGKINPGGKLPVSIARNVGQLPIYYNYKPSARRGYLDGVTKPLYPFGFGLSYTDFSISAPSLAKIRMGLSESTEVSVEVKNTGSRRGDEVVQIYIRDDFSSVTRPVLELKGFKRVTLEPGETRVLVFEIKPSDLWFYNLQMQRKVEPGSFTIFAGSDSVNLKSVKLVVG